MVRTHIYIYIYIYVCVCVCVCVVHLLVWVIKCTTCAVHTTYIKIIFWCFKQSVRWWTKSKKRRLYLYLTLLILCIVIILLQLKPTKWSLILIFISQKFFYMFRPWRFIVNKSAIEHNHCGIMLCPSLYGTVVNHQCVLYIGWSRYIALEAVLCLGEGARYSTKNTIAFPTLLTTRLLPSLS